MVTIERERPASGLIEGLLKVPKAADNMIVGTAKGVIGIISPGLADMMVSLDRSVKGLYVNVVKKTANIGLGIFGRKWE